MLSVDRLHEIAARYAETRIALVGDFCLDRYMEIDPARTEVSIETGLPVYNVVRVRSQPGGAGTILNNLAALGVGRIYPIGFCGDDGEGLELRRAIEQMAPAGADTLLTTPLRRTFTYCKPLVLESGREPRELNRLDSKNWTPTPPEVALGLVERFQAVADEIDAVILLDQVDHAGTGVITGELLQYVERLARQRPQLFMIADSRRGLADYPAVDFKMNRAELHRMSDASAADSLEAVSQRAAALARKNHRHVFVTLAEEGIVGADREGRAMHVGGLPVRGAIDIVGAGDCVTANLTAALAAGADLNESLEIAMAAASVVIHKVGTTGTATTEEIERLL